MSDIDFNRLIKDIIRAARGEATGIPGGITPFGENNKLSITLKLEVTINKNSAQVHQVNQKGSRRLVLMTMDDHE